MRAPLFVISGLLLVAGLTVGATPANAAPAPSPTGTSMPGMDMPGMAVPASTISYDRDAAIRRARQKAAYFKADLLGRNEVQVAGKPPVGDPDGSATGLLRVQGDRVTFAFSWKGITAPTLGHIHQGAAGVNGDVKVPLFTTPMPASATATAGVVTVSDPAIADAIRADPAGFYLNLHTKEFTGGAVRGQLVKLSQPVDLLQLLPGDIEKAFLAGDQEVPVKNGPAVGDPTGRAVAFVKANGGEVDYAFAWVGITPTLGHIHKAPFGVNGPVVVPLFTEPVPNGIVAVAGAVTGIDPALTTDIAAHPKDFYANLHTAQFPGGAVRGQLFDRS